MVTFPELSSTLILENDPEVLNDSSVPAAPPTSIGDCLANVGDVGIRVSSSSSNFVCVHLELVPGKCMVLEVVPILMLSDTTVDLCPSTAWLCT